MGESIKQAAHMRAYVNVSGQRRAVAGSAMRSHRSHTEWIVAGVQQLRFAPRGASFSWMDVLPSQGILVVRTVGVTVL